MFRIKSRAVYLKQSIKWPLLTILDLRCEGRASGFGTFQASGLGFCEFGLGGLCRRSGLECKTLRAEFMVRLGVCSCVWLHVFVSFNLLESISPFIYLPNQPFTHLPICPAHLPTSRPYLSASCLPTYLPT